MPISPVMAKSASTATTTTAPTAVNTTSFDTAATEHGSPVVNAQTR